MVEMSVVATIYQTVVTRKLHLQENVIMGQDSSSGKQLR